MITSHAISCCLVDGPMKVRCSNCLNNEDLITTQFHHHYCNVKDIWIPERKYWRRRKCGKFKPLPWQRQEERQPAMVKETKPTGLKRKKLCWRDWEYWRGFFFLPGFLRRKLRQITNYVSKFTMKAVKNGIE